MIKNIIFIVTFLLMSSLLLVAETTYDIKEVNYNIVLNDNTEIAIVCNKNYNAENVDKLISKICNNFPNKNNQIKINYSTLKKYLENSKLVVKSIDTDDGFYGTKLIGLEDQLNINLRFYIKLGLPKPNNTRFLFWKIDYDEDDSTMLRILNNINGSTISVNFFKEDKKTLLTEKFKILEYKSSLEYKIMPIIELDKPILILSYTTTSTYDIDEERECIMNQIYYKKYNRTINERCESIPVKDFTEKELNELKEKSSKEILKKYMPFGMDAPRIKTCCSTVGDKPYFSVILEEIKSLLGNKQLTDNAKIDEINKNLKLICSNLEKSKDETDSKYEERIKLCMLGQYVDSLKNILNESAIKDKK
ncbi:hypothetical protein [Aliarcobacter butzleri]|uniref:hypothetical protein n=1 Tax=Aliarcobacter butzleri TaxID=28197 RepID=UPI00344EDBE4